MHKAVFFVVAAAAAGLAAAQQPRPNPGDPKAPVPAIEHRSAFEGYRRYTEPEVSGWREMNEEVGRVGGHVGIVRGQRDAQKPGAKPSASPAQGGHEGHK
jgi:hypothetical protein